MNKPIIIANWKMNLTPQEELNLAKILKKKLKDAEVTVVACPSFLSLASMGDVLNKSDVLFGSQDVFWKDAGAYTGEVSPKVLKDIGCSYAIVGHSERRQNLIETSEMVNKKVDACLQNRLIPIVCVGETFEDRQNNQTDMVIHHQVLSALAGIDLVPQDRIIIAYEPVWVIGSGQAVNPADADHVSRVIHQTLIDLWPKSIVDNNVQIIYGGSVDENNVDSFSRLPYINGFLVGGASLDADRFVKIIDGVKKTILSNNK